MTQIHKFYNMWCIQPDILWEVVFFCPNIFLTTVNIQYRWERIAWCVGIILQRELITPGVISLCHKMTLHMSVRESLYGVNKTPTEAGYYIMIQLSLNKPNKDIVLQWTQPEICVTSWEFPLIQPRKSLANACIQYRWDRIARCVAVILQQGVSTRRVISLYHRLTPHMRVWDSLNNVR